MIAIKGITFVSIDWPVSVVKMTESDRASFTNRQLSRSLRMFINLRSSRHFKWVSLINDVRFAKKRDCFYMKLIGFSAIKFVYDKLLFLSCDLNLM